MSDIGSSPLPASTSVSTSVSSFASSKLTPKWRNRKIKVALCLPWYQGSDPECVATHLQIQHYFGRLQERLLHYNPLLPARNLPPLDPANTTGFSEIPPELWGTEIEFGISEEIKCSLVGTARERTIEAALSWGADYVLFYDADMLFGSDLFLRLLLANKPITAALAFTGREPIAPVIYRFKDWKDITIDDKPRVSFESQVVFDYEPNTLQQVDGVGFGVVLIDTDVFRIIPKPWFGNEFSKGIGEDIYLCAMAKHFGIPVHVHTGAKTIHKPTFVPEWHDERKYLAHLAKNGAAA